MNKRVRNAIIWIIAAIIFATSVIILITLPPETNISNAQLDSVSNLTFNDYATTDIYSIKIRNPYDEYTVTVNENGPFIDKLSDIRTSPSKFAALMADCSGVTASQVIAEETYDLSVFGLSNPKIVVEINYTDDECLNLYIGNDAPDSTGVYVCTPEDNTVYLFSPAKVDTFFYSSNDFIYEYITEPLDKDSDVSPTLNNMLIKPANGEKSISIYRGDDENRYFVSSDINYAADKSVVDKYAKSLIGLKSLKIIKYKPTQSDFETYGLANNYSTITAVYDDRAFSLFVSKENNGMIYVSRDNIPVIYELNTASLNVLKAQYKDFAQKNPITSELSALNDITVTIGNAKYQFDISYEQDTKNLQVSRNGKTINSSYFTTFYNNIKTLQNQDFTNQSKTSDKALLIIELTYASDETQNSVISFYSSQADDKALIDIDGVCCSLENMSYVNKIAQDCKSIANNQSIEAISQTSSSAS